jgi:hypothetical protein
MSEEEVFWHLAESQWAEGLKWPNPEQVSLCLYHSIHTLYIEPLASTPFLGLSL